MERLAGFPFFEIQFDKEGRPVDPDAVEELVGFVEGGGATDLLVLSHGWNNDIDDARGLYRRWLPVLRDQVPSVPGVAERQVAVMGIIWPSKKFTEKSEIAGGAAAFDAGGGVTEADLIRHLEALEGIGDEADDRALEEAKGLVGDLERSPEARRRFADLLRGELLPPAEAHADPESAAELPRELYELPGDELLEKLAEPPEEPVDFDSGGAAGGIGEFGGGEAEGGAAGFGDFFGGIKEGAQNLLNLTTGYMMKNRAGLIGAGGVHDLLVRLRRETPVRLHLAGHSFGARLVTAAAAGPEDAPPLEVDSLTLIQGAFSHYSFADQWDPPKESPGFFRRVVTDPRVRGPMLVTYTKNDQAVGVGYALAFRLAGREAVAAAIGDENDIYGGLGRNGALKTPTAAKAKLLAVGGDYARFAEGRPVNLNGDAFIQGHSGFVIPEVAYAMWSAVAATG